MTWCVAMRHFGACSCHAATSPMYCLSDYAARSVRPPAAAQLTAEAKMPSPSTEGLRQTKREGSRDEDLSEVLGSNDGEMMAVTPSQWCWR